jgi:hypothetical protein
VFDTHPEVLPQGSRRQALEVVDNDQASDIAFRRGPLDRGKEDIAIVLGMEFAGRFEADDARR